LAGGAAPIAEGKQVIEAEMPGKVVKVSVAVGAEVQEGEGVVILEAMKMENEIPSPITGVITELGASEGETVEGGALLFVVEPHEQAERR
jgi:biotin carboxyl carrier protein